MTIERGIQVDGTKLTVKCPENRLGSTSRQTRQKLEESAEQNNTNGNAAYLLRCNLKYSNIPNKPPKASIWAEILIK